MKKNVIDKYFVISVGTVIAGLLLTLFLKNNQNGHSIFRFRIDYVGDVLFALIAVIALTAIVTFFSKTENLLMRKIVTFMLLASTLLIAADFFVDEIVSNYTGAFVFGYPLKKFLGAAFFSLSYIILLYVVNTAFHQLLQKESLIFIRAIISTAIIVIVLLLFSFIFTLQNYDSAPNKNLKNETIAFVLGAAVWSKDQPSPIFKSRIEKAYELYSNNRVNKIYVTGGKAPGELTESQVARKVLLGMGVDSNHILSENETSTTSEQIQFIASRKNYFKNKNLYIISDSFHHARIKEMCNFYNVDAECTASGSELSWEKLVYFRFRESVALLLFWLFGV